MEIYANFAVHMQAPHTADTIVAIATPQGTGAIGIIRLSGPRAFEITESIFSKSLKDKATHTLHFGKITANGRVIDEVVVSLFRGPNSYTGEDIIEISCHGSAFIHKQVVDLCLSHGARLATAGEFTLRAYLNKKLDLSQAEAVADVIAANSEASHKAAISQMRGGFSKRIKQLREELIHFASLIELELDFGEEDVEFADRQKLKNLVSALLQELRQLAESFKLGNVIKNGIPVVIAGKPNAGKSTLLNTLLNEERAIVTDIEGTTRDTIEEAIQIEGVLFRFIDTAGIRKTESKVEAIGIEKTFEKISEAAMVLYLFDVTANTPEQVIEEIKDLAGKTPGHILPLGNKTDKDPEAAKAFKAIPGAIFISSATGDVSALLEVFKRESERLKSESGDSTVTNIRHYHALKEAAGSLEQVNTGLDTLISGDLLALDIRRALFHLGEITGDISTDDLLENIFSKFCIGK